MKYDIVVMGAGPAGAVVAMLLAKKGHKVLLLSGETENKIFKVGECLSPASFPILKRLGILDQINEETHLRCYGNQSAWGESSLIDIDFMFTPAGFGWHLDRIAFDLLLIKMAVEAGVEIKHEARVTKAIQNGNGWDLIVKQFSENIAYQTKFLIDATGRSTWLTRQLNIKSQKFDDLIAFTAVYKKTQETKDQDTRTLIEAVAGGWWYTALLPNDRRVLMYFTDAKEPTAKLASTSTGMKILLEETNFIKDKILIAKYELEMAPIGKPAHSMKLSQLVGDHWLAVGDAAVSFDPLSSQGIISAIEGAERAAEAIHSHFTGDREALKIYENYIQEIYDDYLEKHYVYYSSEKRWPVSTFWQKMQGKTFESMIS